MKGWRTAMAIGLVFAAQAALADQAKTRDSGSTSPKSSGSSASSKSSGSSKPSGGAVEKRSSGSPSKSSSRVSEARPRPLTEAERRRPRPGTGTGYRHYNYRGYRYGYNPYYYSGYRPYYGYYGYWGFSPWSYGWDGGSGYYGTGYYGTGYYGSGYYGGGYYGSPRYRYRYRDDMGSVRLMVEPEETKVLVDGHYAGEVDDFDGIFQRLHLTPGRHEITLKLQGHQTHRIRVYVPRDETLKIRHHMQRGAESQVTEESMLRPGDEERTAERERYSRRSDRDDDEDAVDKADDQADDEADAGTVRLDVQPRDASVYVDGEFQGAGRDVDELELAPGRHRIEVVRPGYRTAERDVEVRSGRNADLEVRLER